MRRGAGLLLESTGERPRRHVRSIREVIDGQRAIEVRLGPFEEACEPRRFFGHNRLDRELRLASFTKRGDDEPACHLVRDLRSEVSADEMQAEINPGSAACRREDGTFVDVEDVRLYLNLRVA